MSVRVLCVRSEVVPSSSKRLAYPDAPAPTVSVTASSGFWTSLVTSLLRVGTIPPDLTNTGMVSSPVVMLWVVPPAYVLPVNQSIHELPGGNHTVVVAGFPGVVTGATSTSEPYRYSLPAVAYASCSFGYARYVGRTTGTPVASASRASV